MRRFPRTYQRERKHGKHERKVKRREKEKDMVECHLKGLLGGQKGGKGQCLNR